MAGRPEEAQEARALARTLLDPALPMQLNSPWRAGRTSMGMHEKNTTNLLHARYMDLLGALADEGLLDAREVFERLTVAEGAEGEQAPYLWHIASRGSTFQQHAEAAPAVQELARSAARLLSTLATALERQRIQPGMTQAQQEAVGRTVREEMCARLLREHPHVLSELRRQKYGKYQDVFTRFLLSGSPRYLTQGSRVAASELMAARMLPQAEQARTVWSSERRSKLEIILKQAAKEERARPLPAWPTPGLAQVARQLEQLDVLGAHRRDVAAHAQWRTEQARRSRQEGAHAHFHGAVSGAVNALWEERARLLRRSLAPSFLPLAVVAPMGAAAYAGAANSVELRAPGDLVDHVCEALKSTAQGQQVMERLLASGERYRAGDHPAFDALLGEAVAADVAQTLESLERGLRQNADAVIAASHARDQLIADQRRAEQEARDSAETQRVHALARNNATPRASDMAVSGAAVMGAPTRHATQSGEGVEDGAATPSAERPHAPLHIPLETPRATPPSVQELEQRLLDLRLSHLPPVPTHEPSAQGSRSTSAVPMLDNGHLGRR
jgi:hypothetical protein